MHAPNLRKKLEISWTLRVQKAILTAKKKKKAIILTKIPR